MRRAISILLAVCLLSFVVWWVRMPPLGESREAFNHLVTPEEAKLSEPSVSPAERLELEAKPPEISEENWKRTLRDHRTNAAVYNGPVEFFGKVVDQSGEPVSGANVVLRLIGYPEDIRDRIKVKWENSVSREIVVDSDSVGRFELRGVRGNLLEVARIEKDGYTQQARDTRQFMYGVRMPKHVARYDQPILFVVWKKGPAAKTLRGGGLTVFIKTGIPVRLNLVEGKEVSANGEADVTVVAKSAYSGGIGHYAWEVVLSSEKGGFVLAEEPLGFQAPATGYEKSVTLITGMKDGEWSKLRRGACFLVSRNQGLYGSFVVDAVAGYDKGVVKCTFKWIVNPDGDRNLQPK